AREHVWQHGTRRVDVRHDVDAPAAIPLCRGRLLVAIDRNARVRAEQIDPFAAPHDVGNQVADGGFVGDIGAADRQRPDLPGDGLRGRAVDVDDDDARTLGSEAAAQGASDAVAAPGDNADFVVDRHWSGTQRPQRTQRRTRVRDGVAAFAVFAFVTRAAFTTPSPPRPAIASTPATSPRPWSPSARPRTRRPPESPRESGRCTSPCAGRPRGTARALAG